MIVLAAVQAKADGFQKPDVVYVRVNHTIQIAGSDTEIANFDFKNQKADAVCSLSNAMKTPIIIKAGQVIKMEAAYWETEASWGNDKVSISCGGRSIDSDVRENSGSPTFRPISRRTIAQINYFMNRAITVSTSPLAPIPLQPSRYERFMNWFWTH